MPYKVVISVVDSDMIDNALLDQSEVEIVSEPVRAKWVAHQIALKHAVEAHSLKRIITFHSSIKAAAAFASDEPEGVGIHMPDFCRFHVSGMQPTAEREEHMRAFARVRQGIITNARCLTEGVDVPSVDMVAFMNPRRSRVDIVQAVGRAMRTAGPEKTCGYVLVPLFLEMRKGEAIDEALERSDFKEIAQVLNAMRENDEELSEIIQSLMIERGQMGGFDESRLADKLEVLGPQIKLIELTTAIRSELVEELGSAWDERYGQLVAYKQTFGDCNVPTKWEQNPFLGRWCSSQRMNYKIGKLAPDRVERLEQLGFVWFLRADAWEEMFETLAAYKKMKGDCFVSLDWRSQTSALGLWCGNQRAFYKMGQLKPERVKRLERLGFTWDPVSAEWEEMFAALTDFKRTHGNCDVPTSWDRNPSLKFWCGTQRAFFKSGQLAQDRVERLERIGFVWEPDASKWEEMFAALTDYNKRHGSCNVLYAPVDNSELWSWCNAQRMSYKANELAPDRARRLQQLGFVWRPRVTEWDEMFEALVQYKHAHGDCDVPPDWKLKPALRGWCTDQRLLYRARKLSPNGVERLVDIGFKLNVNEPKRK